MQEPKEITHIKDLKPMEKNPRRHSPRNIGQIEHSLRQYGAARSIVISEEGEIIAGHGVVEAAAQAGIEKVRVVDSSGHEIIAVRRKGLSQKDKKALAVADNRASDLSDWDPDILKELSTEIDLGQFWTEDELSKLLMNESQRNEDLTPQSLTEKYMIIVECATERQQTELLERFTAEGLTCRALVS